MLATLKRWSQLATSSIVGHPRDPALAELFGGGYESDAGIAVNESMAMRVTAFFQAVRILAEGVSTLPIHLYRRQGKRKLVATDHPAFGLVHYEPNDDMTATSFFEAGQVALGVRGNTYAEIEVFGNGQPRAMHLLTAGCVKPKRNASGRLVYEYTPPDRPARDIDRDYVLHVPGLGFDGIMGYAPLDHFTNTIGLSLAIERYGSEFFKNDARPGGHLEHPTKLGKDAYKRLLRSQRKQAEAGNRHRSQIFEEGAKWVNDAVPNEAAQFLESRKFQVLEIARAFNIPPHRLMDLERATFSNIEQQGIEFVIYTLMPWLVRWEQELNRKLLSKEERTTGGMFFKFNVEGLLRGDSKSRGEFYRAMQSVGAYSINMILEAEDEDPIGPEGDVHWVPLNMEPAERAMDRPEPPANAPVPGGVAPGDGSKPPGKLSEPLKGVLGDAVGRMVRRSASQLREAAKKPEKFLSWLDSFTSEHETIFAEAFTPSLAALSHVMERSASPSLLASAMLSHVRRDVLALSDAATADTIKQAADELAAKWESELTNEVVSWACARLEVADDHARAA